MVNRVFHPCPELSDVVEYFFYSRNKVQNISVQNYTTPLLQGLAFNFNNKTEWHTFNEKTVALEKLAYFFGQPTCPRVITTNENGVDILGVKFKPLGIAKITGINMEHVADQFIAAEDVWGNELEFLCDEMRSAATLDKAVTCLENFLLKKYLKMSSHYRINNAQNALSLISAFNGNIDIKILQSKTNTSRKTLERAFLHYVGLTPKFYARIIRFNALKERMDCKSHIENLTSLAYDFGFYDSSHLAAEFKYFSGITPTSYLNSNRDFNAIF